MTFTPLPVDPRLEQVADAKTLFYGQLNSNLVWCFERRDGQRLVAVSDGDGQVVLSASAVAKLAELLA
jgi:hypothetical protein